MYSAVSGGKPDRVPTLPKIWVDLAATLTGVSFKDVIRDPYLTLTTLIEASLMAESDAARQFYYPAKNIMQKAAALYETNETGDILGKIDLEGGFATCVENPALIRLDDPYFLVYKTSYACHEPLVRDIQDVRRMAVPTRAYLNDIGIADMQRRVMDEYQNRIALIGDLGSATLSFCATYRGMNQLMFDFFDDPALLHALMDKGVEIAVEHGKFLIDLGFRILRLNDSTANMNVISPDLFREFVAPRFKQIRDELRAYDDDVRIYCHICGDVKPILEDLVSTGIDCVGPLDPLGGFTCAEARAIVGDAVALMGGVNTLSFVNGSPDDIISEATACLQGAGKDGGYILGSGCVVPRQAKLENLKALATAAKESST